MKLAHTLLWAFAANAAVLRDSTLEKRQSLDGFFGGTNSPIFLYPAPLIAKKTPLKPVASHAPKAEIFGKASRQRLIYGPFQLQPVAGKHKTGEGGFKLDRHSDLFEETLGGICRNCMILALHYDVTDKTGKKLLPRDETYTHHMVLGSDIGGKPMNPLKVNRTCSRGFGGLLGGGLGDLPLSPRPPRGSAGPKGSSPRGPPGFASFPDFSKLGGFFINPPVIILNKGQEKNAINFMSLDQDQQTSGFWIGKNDTIMTSVEIVNYKQTTQDVYLTLDLEYLNFDTRPNTYHKTEFASLVGTSCNSFSMLPQSDRMVTYETPQYSVQKNLYLVDLNPHLHDGALNMKVHVNGKVVCIAEAIYGREGGMSTSGQEWETISHYTPCKTTRLHPGDQFKVTSDYDLRQHTLRPDSANHEMGSEAMAMAFIQFVSAD